MNKNSKAKKWSLFAAGLKRRMLGLKYYILRYSKEQVFAKTALSNNSTDSIKEVGLLISTAFMVNGVMTVALETAFKRLQSQECLLFSKTTQYYKALLFLQKVCMQSEAAKAEIKKNYLCILPFVFYNQKGAASASSIRLLSISILKQINAKSISYVNTHTTFVTCVSQPLL